MPDSERRLFNIRSTPRSPMGVCSILGICPGLRVGTSFAAGARSPRLPAWLLEDRQRTAHDVGLPRRSVVRRPLSERLDELVRRRFTTASRLATHRRPPSACARPTERVDAPKRVIGRTGVAPSNPGTKAVLKRSPRDGQTGAAPEGARSQRADRRRSVGRKPVGSPPGSYGSRTSRRANWTS